MACIRGHIDIIKYLLTIAESYSGHKIDIHIYKNQPYNAFADICRLGYIDIIKYLTMIAENYSGIKFDIHYQDDIAFSQACRYAQINIAKFLIKTTQKYSNKPINIHSHIYKWIDTDTIVFPNASFIKTIGYHIIKKRYTDKSLMKRYANILL